MEADEVEAGGEHDADGEHHQEAKPRVRAEPPVDLEVRLPCLRALRLRCERREQVDHAVAFGDPVPGRGEREEDRDDGVRRLVTVRRDRVEDRAPRRQVAELLVDPDEHVVTDARRMVDRGAADVALRERLLELV